jgi:hypothetical protein
VEYRALAELEAERKIKNRDKEEHYFARLIAEVRRSWVKDPKSVTEDECLITFLTPKEAAAQEAEKKTKARQVDPEVQKANQLAIEKATWGIITGRLLPGGKPPRSKRKK